LEETDPYSTSLVRSELKVRSEEPGVIQSWSQKGLHRLGDRVSIALLKVVDERDLIKPELRRIFLSIIRDSFDQPQLILIGDDKKPKVTFFLLSYLLQNVSDAQSQREIRETMEFVRAKAEH